MIKQILKNNRDVDNFMRDIETIISPDTVETLDSVMCKITIDHDSAIIGVLDFDLFCADILDNLADVLKNLLKIDCVWLFVEYTIKIEDLK